MDDVIKKGCHPAAQKYAAFIAQEMLEFAESSYWTILPCSKVRHLPGLRGSPAHMINRGKDNVIRAVFKEKKRGFKPIDAINLALELDLCSEIRKTGPYPHSKANQVRQQEKAYSSTRSIHTEASSDTSLASLESIQAYIGWKLQIRLL